MKLDLAFDGDGHEQCVPQKKPRSPLVILGFEKMQSGSIVYGAEMYVPVLRSSYAQ
jgi:hypothetical protein